MGGRLAEHFRLARRIVRRQAGRYHSKGPHPAGLRVETWGRLTVRTANIV
jgi:hypothetical protein